jgi:hypothetical protein
MPLSHPTPCNRRPPTPQQALLGRATTMTCGGAVKSQDHVMQCFDVEPVVEVNNRLSLGLGRVLFLDEVGEE